MPESEGEWTYRTRSNRPELDGKTGRFEVARPSAGNHGPVRVHRTFHFAYADGSPYYPIGTTCYAWTSQGDSLEEQTLATLKQAPFNKLRMCVFPKSYEYNRNEPPLYPFEGTAPRGWDFSRFNPEFFRHLERRIGDLRDLGIEADLILFHPYDKGHWGFDRMPPEADDRYLRYVLARLSSYRNVWWSLANEFDFMKEKTDADWDRLLRIVAAEDPHGHLRSIHNGTRIYDHDKPWVTHASLQNGSAVADFGRAVLYRDVYEKPIVLDEVKYEGDFPERWGNLSAEEMVHRFWQGTDRGDLRRPRRDLPEPRRGRLVVQGGQAPGREPPPDRLPPGDPRRLAPRRARPDRQVAGGGRGRPEGGILPRLPGQGGPRRGGTSPCRGPGRTRPMTLRRRPHRHLGGDDHAGRRDVRLQALGTLHAGRRGPADDRPAGQALPGHPVPQGPLRGSLP